MFSYITQRRKLCSPQTSVGEYFDSDGYLGQEEIFGAFLKLAEPSERVKGVPGMRGVVSGGTVLVASSRVMSNDNDEGWIAGKRVERI